MGIHNIKTNKVDLVMVIILNINIKIKPLFDAKTAAPPERNIPY
jgi:hypothetical protein